MLAADPGTLAQAERVIVDGFPQRALQPYRPGCSLPPLVLAVPGWRTWVAYRDGEPAAACCTYDDGATVGVYWLATLPRHRSRGLGRAIMSAALGPPPGGQRCWSRPPWASPSMRLWGFRLCRKRPGTARRGLPGEPGSRAGPVRGRAVLWDNGAT